MYCIVKLNPIWDRKKYIIFDNGVFKTFLKVIKLGFL